MKHIFRTTTLVAFIIILTACQNTGLQLTTEFNSQLINTNTPTLCWEAIECDSFELWIDDIKMADLQPEQTCYTTFPLSFGKHKWEIKAIVGKKTIVSSPDYFIIDDAPLVDLPTNASLLRYDWYVNSSYTAGSDGKSISQAAIDVTDWSHTSVPATVLTALVRNGIYPNPYVGMNNMLIPDSNDEYNEEYNLLQYSHLEGVNPWSSPYWYRKEFEYPAQLNQENIWLNFGELNYKADIWLNGTLIADTATAVGMERAYKFDVTDLLLKDKKNTLAVLIYPPSPVGKPAIEPVTPLGDPGQNMGDGMISTNYTKWDTMGWDWQPAVRDRDMGITEDVFLSGSSSIMLDNLYISSNLQLPDTTSADITISADLLNVSDRPFKGIIEVSIAGPDNFLLSFKQPFQSKAKSTESFTWNKKNIKGLRIKNPLLWWPYDYGTPHLYSLNIEVRSDNEDILEEVIENFGIRKVETYIGANERVYKINGREIYLKGGNWVMDMMLNWPVSRYEKEILLTRNANLNILRVWGPTGVAPKPLYEAADKYGVLIWQDFLNDFWGTFKNTPGYQPEQSLYKEITTEVVKKYRNHPSLIIWCGGNEGVNPREQMIVDEILAVYDNRDSRHYLKQSDGDGLHGGGPYHTLEPKQYFLHRKLNGFSSEIGPSGVPVVESVRRFIPGYGEGSLPGFFPLNANWAYHDANDWPAEDTRKFSAYHKIVTDYYGTTDTINLQKGLEEYLNKAQLVNYDVYRASIESINRQLWDNSSGILLWKSNSSWPSMTWQIYDWYLQAHAGYYGTKKAASPMSMQWNRDDNSISLINLTKNDYQNLVAMIQIYDIATGYVDTVVESHISIQSDKVIKIATLVNIPIAASIMKLSILDSSKNVLADNYYWLNQNNDYTAFNKLPAPSITINQGVVTKKDGKTKYEFEIDNEDGLAYMVALKVVGEKSKSELLPSYWSDNYVTLLPNESKKVSVELFDIDVTEKPILEYSTYNTEKKWIKMN